MNLLLDTNGLLWWLDDSSRLGIEARRVLADLGNRVYVSAASGWEIAIKIARGKLKTRPNVARWLPTQLAAHRFIPLPISLEHALAVEHLPTYHTDPFDRLLIAQASAEGLTIITGDRQFEQYGIEVIRC